MAKRDPAILYEFDGRPDYGDLMEVAPGVHWLRVPLPVVLSHINLWVLDDGEGWCVVDTGMATETIRNIWRQAFVERLDRRPVRRVLVTHLHPDHVGLAGWLSRRFDAELWMTRTEFLLCRNLVADTGRTAPEAGVRFYREAGYSEPQLARYIDRFGEFGKGISPLPDAYRRIRDGDAIQIGRHQWRVLVGQGHSPEHACLFCEELNVMFSGDQILPTISSNVSVYPTEPAADPLGEWLESCRTLQRELPEDVLVLPAHGRPFRGAHARLQKLIDEHEEGLSEVRALCADQPRRAIDLFEVLFRGAITDSNLIMAAGESVAHLNYLTARGELEVSADDAGVKWYRAV